jgi:hypothetical protein
MNGLSEFLQGKIKIPMPRAGRTISSTMRESESTITNLHSKFPEVYATFETGMFKEITTIQMRNEKLIKVQSFSPLPPPPTEALPITLKVD